MRCSHNRPDRRAAAYRRGRDVQVKARHVAELRAVVVTLNFYMEHTGRRGI
jgi:hypothetical protein